MEDMQIEFPRQIVDRGGAILVLIHQLCLASARND